MITDGLMTKETGTSSEMILPSFELSLCSARGANLFSNLVSEISTVRFQVNVDEIYIEGLAQDSSNSIAKALELMQSYIKPSTWYRACHKSETILFSTMTIST